MGFAIFALFASINAAPAQEFELRAADLRIVGDPTWTGGGWGGYHPIRLEIANYGPGRDLELRFSPHERGGGIPTVRRRLRVEQNASARVTLSVPLLGGGGGGKVEVLLDGVPIDGLRRDVTLAQPAGGAVPTPSLLVISPDPADTGGFELAASAMAQDLQATSVPTSHFLGRMAVPWEVRHAVVGPTLLPASWIDYSGVDLVAIRLDTLAALRPDERAALLDWVEAGGRLIVHRVGSAPPKSDDLGRLLGPAAATKDPKTWRPAEAGDRRDLPVVLSAYGGPFPSAVPNEGSPATGEVHAYDTRPKWRPAPPPFFVRRVGFGHVASLTGDLFTGTGADWAWLLRALGGPTTTWPVRYGLTSGGGDAEFINLPIPGVTGVPTLAFLSLITLFALAIGPANYFLLWRKKQLSRLVLTVPAVAAVTSVLLFGYAAVAQGFGTKGRVRSVTLLDPATNTATSVGRVAVFAGMAPSRGLRFSNDTAVFPLLPYGEQFTDGEVDWTETQALAAGWLNTRTRAQFVTVTRRDERGRITVTPAGRTLRAVNGLSVPLRYLLVTAADGRPYFGRGIAAGGEATLEPLGEEDRKLVREFASERLPGPPDGVTRDEIVNGFGGRPWRWMREGWKPQFQYGLLERHLTMLSGGTYRLTSDPNDATRRGPGPPMPNEAAVRIDSAAKADSFDPLSRPRSFLAVADADPGIDLGGLHVDERDSVHVLMGTW